MFRQLARIADGLNRITEFVCAALLSCLIVVAAMQVFYRYVLLQPLIWSEEAARYLLIWLSFAAAGVVLRENGHPRVEIIDQVLDLHARKVLAVVLLVLEAGFLLVFIWVSWHLALRYVPFASLGTGLSQSIPRFALPVGGMLLFLNLVPGLIAAGSRHGRDPAEAPRQ